MSDISCQYRTAIDGQAVCQVVAEFMDRPLAECYTNDAACVYCLQCGIAPQVPNAVVAAMAIGVARRANDAAFYEATWDRFRPHLNQAPAPNTACVLRGVESRKVACKPCQANSLTPVMVPVSRCPKHQECTLHNTGTFPKIQACATCPDRLEQYVQLDVKLLPAAVVAAIPRHGPL